MKIKNPFYTHTFNEIYQDFPSFQSDYTTTYAYGLQEDKIDSSHLSLLYSLITARHGYDRVATKPFIGFEATHEEMLQASDNQFKREFWATVCMYGALWQRKHEIQINLRELSDAEIYGGAKQIINTANNPSTDPATTDVEELQFIDNQTTTNYQKSKMEGLNILWDSLHSNPTEDFLKKFDKLFKPMINTWYNYSGYEEDDA